MKEWIHQTRIDGLALELCWREADGVRLSAVRFGFNSASTVTASQLPELSRRQLGELGALLRGEIETMDLTACDLSGLTGFQRRILLALHERVPRGRLVSYGVLAQMAGAAGAARATGSALHINPLPVIIPCHRVVCGDRSLGGFGGGLEMKRQLLAREGVAVGPSGRFAAALLLGADRA